MSSFLFKFAKPAALTFILQIASVSIHAQTRALSYRFLIPEGYVGWIRVDFDVPDAQPLPVEDGFYIFKFPESGRLQTSSGDVAESRRNEFLYYSNDGKYRLHEGGPLDSRLVQQEMSGPGSGQPAPVPNHYRYFFIGPTDVFHKYQASDKRVGPHEPDGGPRVGAQSWLTREETHQDVSVASLAAATNRLANRIEAQDDTNQVGIIRRSALLFHFFRCCPA